jgi:hypothetical protein
VDLSCIISSGELELYVLGMLSPEDAYKIEQLAILFPEVKAEIDQLSITLENLASASAAVPPPSVKNELMSRLKQLKAEENKNREIPVHSPTPTINPQKEETNTSRVIPMQKGYVRPLWLAASLIALVLCIGAVLYMAGINQQRRSDIAILTQKVDTLNNAYVLQQQQLQAYRQNLEILYNKDFAKIELTNLPGKPQAVAEVFWNRKTDEVFLLDVSLPQAPANKQYQLWAIVNGQPVSAGLLSDTKLQAQKMNNFDAAEAFAITLENKGGSATPTLSEMYVMAKVS